MGDHVCRVVPAHHPDRRAIRAVVLLVVAAAAGAGGGCSGCGASSRRNDGGSGDAARDVQTALDHASDSVDANSGPVMLYQDAGGPNGLALDDTYVYWSSYYSGLIQRLPKSGGSVEVLAQLARITATKITVDATNVYVTDRDNDGNDYVGYVPKTGGSLTMIQTDQAAYSHSPFARGAYLYWLTGTDRAPGVMARAPLAGGATEVLGSGYLGTGSVVVDDQYVYWSLLGDGSAGQGQVLRIPVAGGTVETVLTGLDTPLSLALDSNKLFLGLGSVTRVSNNIFNGQIVSIDRNASAPARPVAVAADQSGVFALAVDGTNVYWIAGVPHDGIFKAAEAGGDAPVKLASEQASPVDIAVDDRFVYWINGSVPNGAVMRLPK